MNEALQQTCILNKFIILTYPTFPALRTINVFIFTFFVIIIYYFSIGFLIVYCHTIFLLSAGFCCRSVFPLVVCCFFALCCDAVCRCPLGFLTELHKLIIYIALLQFYHIFSMLIFFFSYCNLKLNPD